MKKSLSIATLVLASAAARGADADTLNWAPGIVYGQGVSPAIALGTTPSGEWAIELQQGQASTGQLWSMSGKAAGTGLPVLQSAQGFDFGFAPAVATLDTSPNTPAVVEVHQGEPGAGVLWYSVGTMSNLATPGTLSWTSDTNYGSGFAPSVAENNGLVVEMHQSTAGAGTMMYEVGTASGTSVTLGSAQPTDYGVAPSVAIATANATTTVIEVHQGGEGFGPLWYSTGTISGNTINWTSSAIYDYGVAPRIAVYQSRVIEVHEGGNGAGPLWYHIGAITGTNQSYRTSTGGVAWDPNAYEYSTTGFAPAVAFDPLSVQGYELHQETTGTSPLVSQIFSTRAVVPFYPQVESQWCWNATANMAIQTVLGDVKNDLNNSLTVAEDLECLTVNYVQDYTRVGQDDGIYVNCCASLAPSSWTYYECNRGGDYAPYLSMRGITHNDTTSSVSFSTLQNELANGRPVPFGISWNPPSSGGHAMIVAGTETDTSGGQWVVINDPGGVQWINPYSFFSNTSSTVGPWVVTEMSTNLTVQ